MVARVDEFRRRERCGSLRFGEEGSLGLPCNDCQVFEVVRGDAIGVPGCVVMSGYLRVFLASGRVSIETRPSVNLHVVIALSGMETMD